MLLLKKMSLSIFIFFLANDNKDLVSIESLDSINTADIIVIFCKRFIFGFKISLEIKIFFLKNQIINF